MHKNYVNVEELVHNAIHYQVIRSSNRSVCVQFVRNSGYFMGQYDATLGQHQTALIANTRL